MDIKRILIIGGDSRTEYLGKALSDDGFAVENYSEGEPLKNSIDRCDAVILGLPASKDDKTVDAPKLQEQILLKDLFKLTGRNKLLLAGKMSEGMKAVADVFGVKWVDYFMRDELEILNSIPTCEGAVQIAMEELPITLFGANVLVTGFGKVGEPLCVMLKHLGANVTVCARRAAQRAKARTMGIRSVNFSYLGELMADADVVFNTVPEKIIGGNELVTAGNTLIIDLASKPGGVDMEKAKDMGVKVIWALGLPGKVAPVTSGNIIKETILNIFSELGE